MEKKYLKFQKLNKLLEKSFKAERIYYNSAEDVQEVNLKRFLAHQSVDRNRFSHEISEQLVQAKIEPRTKWIQKGHFKRDWREELRVLEKKQPLKYLKKCIKRDEKNLKLYEEIIEAETLPKNILKMLKKQQQSIQNALVTAEKFRTGETPLMPAHTSKVIALKAI